MPPARAEVYERGVHLVPLTGLKGVWCGSADGQRDLALVNVIKTAIDKLMTPTDNDRNGGKRS